MHVQPDFCAQHVFLFSTRFAMIFASSGLDPALQIWLCRKTIPQTRGLIFGWAASARSFGWFLAPLTGGIVTKNLGIRWLFVVGPLFFIVIMLLIMRVMRRFSDYCEEEA
ncbi:MAG: MFS transporter [Victivallales bacterium]